VKVVTTKIAAARSQIRDAITMWFHDGELPSIHVLACSAHQIIADINSARGGRDLIYDSIVIKNEYRTEWIRLIKGPYNFLKHAERDPDPDEKIELQSETTEFFILFTCLGVNLLGYELDPTEHAFTTYFLLTHPHLIRKDCKFDAVLTDQKGAGLAKLPKPQFLEAVLTVTRVNAST
jgi:hypothetical protein